MFRSNRLPNGGREKTDQIAPICDEEVTSLDTAQNQQSGVDQKDIGLLKLPPSHGTRAVSDASAIHCVRQQRSTASGRELGRLGASGQEPILIWIGHRTAGRLSRRA